MTYEEYSKFKYHVEKEYLYYSSIFSRDEEDKNNLRFYTKIKEMCLDFEKKALSKALENKEKSMFVPTSW